MWYHEKILRKGVIWMELCKRDETQAEKVCMDVLPESKAVLNQSDAVCIPLTAAASSILSISIYC